MMRRSNVAPRTAVIEYRNTAGQQIGHCGGSASDREVIDRYVTRIIVRSDSIDIELREPTAAPAP